MKPDPDNDLRTCFQAQRSADREEAPVWNPLLLEPPRKPVVASWIMWIGLPTTAVAVIAIGLLLFSFPSSQTRLSEALPVLLDAPAEPLFVGLESSAFSSPSDFLLPSHLSIQLP